MVLGIGRIQQRIKAASPGRYLAGKGKQSAHNEPHSQQAGHQSLEEQIKVLLGYARAQIVHEGVDLAQTKNAQGLQRQKGLTKLARPSNGI